MIRGPVVALVGSLVAETLGVSWGEPAGGVKAKQRGTEGGRTEDHGPYSIHVGIVLALPERYGKA